MPGWRSASSLSWPGASGASDHEIVADCCGRSTSHGTGNRGPEQTIRQTLGATRGVAAAGAGIGGAGGPQRGGQDDPDAYPGDAAGWDGGPRVVEWAGYAHAGRARAPDAGLPAPGVRPLPGVHGAAVSALHGGD